jgi:hypothetical protein
MLAGARRLQRTFAAGAAISNRLGPDQTGGPADCDDSLPLVKIQRGLPAAANDSYATARLFLAPQVSHGVCAAATGESVARHDGARRVGSNADGHG